MMDPRWWRVVHSALALVVLLAASLACGHGSANSQAAAPRDREHEIISLCNDQPDHDEYWCLHLARAYAKGDAEAHIARDLPRAIAMYDRFCDVHHNGPSCLLSASYRARGQAAGDADPWFAKACRAGVTDSAMYFDKSDVEGTPCTKAASADPAAAVELHRLGCARRETESCIAHAGDLVAEGRREDAAKVYGDACFFDKRVDACVAAANADTAEVSTYLRNACDLGDAASCTKLKAKANAEFEEAKRRFAETEKENRATAEQRAATSNASTSTSSASATESITMQSVNVNGLTVTSLSCSNVSGGMLATLTITAALGERATALRACGVHGTVHATWTASGGAISTVVATPANACVVSALRASKLTMAKRCEADFAL